MPISPPVHLQWPCFYSRYLLKKWELQEKYVLRYGRHLYGRSGERTQPSGVPLICTNCDTMNPFLPSLDPFPAYISSCFCSKRHRNSANSTFLHCTFTFWAPAGFGCWKVWLIRSGYVKQPQILCIKFSLTQILGCLLLSECYWVLFILALVPSKSQHWGK